MARSPEAPGKRWRVVPAVVLFCLLCLQYATSCLPKECDANNNCNHCPCDKDEDCQVFTKESGLKMHFPPQCDTVQRKCLNVFRGGCLDKSKFKVLDKLRACFPPRVPGKANPNIKQCSSEKADTSEGNCRACIGDNDHQCTDDTGSSIYQNNSVNMLPQNWQSAQVLGSVAQILMVEILKYPAKYILKYAREEEDGWKRATVSKGFYEDYMAKPLYLHAGVAYDLESIRKCFDLDKSRANECVDVMMEVWDTLNAVVGKKVDKATGLPLSRAFPSHVTGEIGLMVPKWVLDQHPELASYRGYRERYRARNAQLFKRPVRWAEYCDEFYSSNNQKWLCPVPNHLNGEKEQYYVKNHSLVLYGGYFAANGLHNCTKNPKTCRGTTCILDYCDWSTYSKMIFHLNNIKMGFDGGNGTKRGGIDLQDTERVYEAAVENDEAIMIWHWVPELLFYQSKTVKNGKYELVKVRFPPPSGRCGIARGDAFEKLCVIEKNKTLMDSPLYKDANCDWASDNLDKVVTTRLQLDGKGLDKAVYNKPSVPTPVYNFLQNLKIDNRFLDKFFSRFLELKGGVVDGTKAAQVEQYLVNHAVCEIINDEEFNSILTDWMHFLPSKYVCPIVVRFKTRVDAVVHLYLAFQVLSLTMMVFCIFAAIWVWLNKEKKQIKKTQPKYTLVILAGAALEYLHIFFLLTEPSMEDEASGKAHCIASRFCHHLGIFMTLVPLFAILNAVNHLLSTKSLRSFDPKRGKKEAHNMLRNTILLITFVTIYLIVWTVVEQNTQGPRKIYSSRNDLFYEQARCTGYNLEEDRAYGGAILAIAEYGLLLWGAFLSIQNRKVKKEFRSSTSVGLSINNAVMSLVIPCLLSLEAIQIDNDPAIIDLWGGMALWWIFTVLLVFYYFPKLAETVSESIGSVVNGVCKRIPVPKVFLLSTSSESTTEVSEVEIPVVEVRNPVYLRKSVPDANISIN